MSYLIGGVLERAIAYGLRHEYANLGFCSPNEAAQYIYSLFFKNLGSLENKEYYAARFAALEIQKGREFVFEPANIDGTPSISVNGVTIYAKRKIA